MRRPRSRCVEAADGVGSQTVDPGRISPKWWYLVDGGGIYPQFYTPLIHIGYAAPNFQQVPVFFRHPGRSPISLSTIFSTPVDNVVHPLLSARYTACTPCARQR